MASVDPFFVIDEKGRVICAKHSNYKEFVSPKDFFQDLYLEIELTCKTCLHYKKDECYFSKARLDGILNQLDSKLSRKKAYACKLCGKKIERMFTIVHKLYYKEKYEVEFPLICCNCYDYLNYDEFMRESVNRIYFFILFLIVGIFFSMVFLFFMELFNLLNMLIFIWLIPWSLMIFNRLKKLKATLQGINYYKKHFAEKNTTS